MACITVEAWKCDLCGFIWLKQPGVIPKQCPSRKCRTRIWNCDSEPQAVSSAKPQPVRQPDPKPDAKPQPECDAPKAKVCRKCGHELTQDGKCGWVPCIAYGSKQA